MHQNSLFSAKKNQKNIMGAHDRPYTPPLSASILAPTALDLGLRGDCHGSYGLLATPLLGPRPPTS